MIIFHVWIKVLAKYCYGGYGYADDAKVLCSAQRNSFIEIKLLSICKIRSQGHEHDNDYWQCTKNFHISLFKSTSQKYFFERCSYAIGKLAKY